MPQRFARARPAVIALGHRYAGSRQFRGLAGRVGAATFQRRRVLYVPAPRFRIVRKSVKPGRPRTFADTSQTPFRTVTRASASAPPTQAMAAPAKVNATKSVAVRGPLTSREERLNGLRVALAARRAHGQRPQPGRKRVHLLTSHEVRLHMLCHMPHVHPQPPGGRTWPPSTAKRELTPRPTSWRQPRSKTL